MILPFALLTLCATEVEARDGKSSDAICETAQRSLDDLTGVSHHDDLIGQALLQLRRTHRRMEEMCTRKATWASQLSGGKLPLHPSFFESNDQKKKRNMLPEDTLFTDSRVPRDFHCQLARNVCRHIHWHYSLVNHPKLSID